MGPIKIFEIQFPDGKTVYFPGDVVRGTCVIDLSKEIKLKYLRLTMKGRAKVHWTERNSDENSTDYSSRIDYFTVTQTLFGKEHSSAESILPEGRKAFNFAFNLPAEGICSSYEGMHGNIRYRMEAEIGQKWKLFNDKLRKDFIVSTVTDTNRPEFQIPLEFKADKSVCSLRFKSGLISLNVQTTKTGYCTGESIPIWAEVSNQSSRTVVLYAKLKQIQTFFAKNNKKMLKATVAEVRGSPVKAYDKGSWNGESLSIPSTIPTLNAGIIKVEYFLKVSLSIPFSRNLETSIPITIGNVAYNQQHNSQFNVHPQIPASFTETNVPPQFPPPYPFNMGPQFPLPVAPSDMFPHEQFPIFAPITGRYIALNRDGSYPPRSNHEPPPPYQENPTNPSRIN